MAKWWNAKRFDLVEVGLMALVVGVAALSLLRRPATTFEEDLLEEKARLERQYGPDKFSSNEEEWIIRDFFRDRRGGVFVDVGAGHYASGSNTVYLERALGWSGLAIEPFEHFKADYTAHRPKTRFLPYFISDVSGQEVKMYTHGEMFAASSSNREHVERFGDNPKEFVKRTITLNELLERENIHAFDFMSMDIELAEPAALAGLDIERFQPALVCIEAHPEVRQQILDYFTRHGYVVVGQYLRVDEGNLYFTPLERAAATRR